MFSPVGNQQGRNARCESGDCRDLKRNLKISRTILSIVGAIWFVALIIFVYAIHLKSLQYESVQLRQLTEKEQILLYLQDKSGSRRIFNQAKWIIEHESKWNTQVVGDGDKKCPFTGKKQRSRGLVQISDCYNSKITDAQAFDWKFSVDFLVSNLKQGRASLWSSWKFRRVWFR